MLVAQLAAIAYGYGRLSEKVEALSKTLERQETVFYRLEEIVRDHSSKIGAIERAIED